MGELAVNLARRLAWMVVAVRLVLLDGLEIFRVRGLNDYASFHFAALAIYDGQSPYRAEVLQRIGREFGIDRVHPYIYPPFLAELLLPLSYLEPWPARVVWWLISLVAMAVVFRLIDGWLAGRYAFFADDDEGVPEQTAAAGARETARALFAFSMVLFWPIRDSMRMSQVNTLVLLFIVLWLWKRRRSPWAATFLGLAIAIKMSPALLVLFPLSRRAWREAAIATSVGVFAIVLSCLALGAYRLDFLVDVAPGFVPGAKWHALTVPINLFFNHSLAALAFALTHNPDPFRLGNAGATLHLGMAAALLCAWAVTERDGLLHGPASSAWREPSSLAALLVLMIIAPTYAYEHHLVHLTFGIAVMAKLVAEGSLSLRFGAALAVGQALLSARVEDLIPPAAFASLEPYLRFPKLPAMLLLFVAALAARRRARSGREDVHQTAERGDRQLAT